MSKMVSIRLWPQNKKWLEHEQRNYRKKQMELSLEYLANIAINRKACPFRGENRAAGVKEEP